MRRRLTVLACLTALVGSATATAPATAASGDTVSVTGYDFVSERAAPVTAGDADNRLVLTYVAGAPLADGTVSFDVPTTTWRTPLVALPAGTSLTPDDVGAVAARPALRQNPVPAVDCMGAGGSELQAFVLVSRGVSTVVVPHVDCAAGAALLVRINGVRAPRAGRYAFPVRAADASGTRLATRAPLTVVPAARTRLELRLPAGPFVADRPFGAAIIAVRPGGSIDRGYRGAVALAPDDLDFCGFVAEPGRAFTFTEADAGVLLLTLDFGQTAADGVTRTMTVRALDRSARPATSAPYGVVIVDDPNINTCAPVSFH